MEEIPIRKKFEMFRTQLEYSLRANEKPEIRSEIANLLWNVEKERICERRPYCDRNYFLEKTASLLGYAQEKISAVDISEILFFSGYDSQEIVDVKERVSKIEKKVI